MKKKSKGIFFGVVFAACALFFLCGTAVEAAGLFDENEAADTVHLFSKYPLKNYSLDFYVSNSGGWLPWNWGESIGKGITYGLYCITNFIWMVSLFFAETTGSLIQEAYNLDFVGDMTGKIGKSMQSLSGITVEEFGEDGLYMKLILFIIAIVGVYVAYTGLLKKETSKAMYAFLNLILVFAFSAALIAYAPKYMAMLNEFSSDLSGAILDAGVDLLDPVGEDEDGTATIRDTLFLIQVEKPWLILQYGTTDKEEIGEERIESLLSVSPSLNKGEDRENVVKGEVEEWNNQNLTVTEAAPRLGMAAFIFLLNVFISVFVLLLTGIMILSQILFLIFALVLVVGFIISMIPGQENVWKKALVNLFNTLMMRAGITLIVTFAFCLSNMFYSMSESYPFVMTMFLQIILFAGIYMKMNDILGVMSLRANDSEQLGRRVFQRPYRRTVVKAKQEKRKLGTYLKKTFRKNPNGSHSQDPVSGRYQPESGRRPDTPKTPKKNNTRDAALMSMSGKESQQKKGNIGKRMGSTIGVVADTGGMIKGKAGHTLRQVKNVPLNMRYGVYKIGDSISENVDGMKTGFSEERTSRKTGRKQRAVEYRNKMDHRRADLENRKLKKTEGKWRENVSRQSIAQDPGEQRAVYNAVKSPDKQKRADTGRDKNRTPDSSTNTLSAENGNRDKKPREQTTANQIKTNPVRGTVLPTEERKSRTAMPGNGRKENYQNISKRINRNVYVSRGEPKVRSVSVKERRR